MARQGRRGWEGLALECGNEMELISVWEGGLLRGPTCTESGMCFMTTARGGRQPTAVLTGWGWGDTTVLQRPRLSRSAAAVRRALSVLQRHLWLKQPDAVMAFPIRGLKWPPVSAPDQRTQEKRLGFSRWAPSLGRGERAEVPRGIVS